MNYLGQVAVDTVHPVITGAMADFADKRDSQCLQNIVEQTSDKEYYDRMHRKLTENKTNNL